MYAGRGSYLRSARIPSQAASNGLCGNPAIGSAGKCCNAAELNYLLGDMDSQAEGDEEILAFDIPDETLERAASAEQMGFTWVYCTNGYYWYDCSWPQ